MVDDLIWVEMNRVTLREGEIFGDAKVDLTDDIYKDSTTTVEDMIFRVGGNDF